MLAFRLIAAAAALFLIAASPPPPPFTPPPGAQSAKCVAALGDIYWIPKMLPFGPVYGAFNGKLVFEEYMIPQRDFEIGRNWQDLGVKSRGTPVDHVDIWFASHGHDGAPMPHYDVILFFVPHAEHMRYCNPSGALPDFVQH